MRNEATALQQMKARVQEAGWVTCIERIGKDERHMLLCSFQCLRGGAVEGIRHHASAPVLALRSAPGRHGSHAQLGGLDFEQGGGEQQNAQGTFPGPVSLLGGCVGCSRLEAWDQRGEHQCGALKNKARRWRGWRRQRVAE